MEETGFVPTPLPRYPGGNRELMLGVAALALGACLCNCVFWGGFNLGFGLCSLAFLGVSVLWLKRRGCGFDGYSRSLLILAAVIAAGFGRSGDSGLKFWMLGMLLFAANLGLCIGAGQNRRSPGTLGSALDVPRTVFVLGFGGLGKTARGLRDAAGNTGAAGKKGGAVLLGLVLAVPLGAVMVFLLMRSDAAFEGLMDGLPAMNWGELMISLLLGAGFGWFWLSQCLALIHAEKAFPAPRGTGINPITWNVVLSAAAGIYCVYLLSQLAYLGGGFAGILPEDYTLAQYARRGFFEMAWLGAINLGLICLSMHLAEKGGNGLTRLLCLFLGAVTLFLVCAASAKMLLYIRGYGLTRLRVLTQVVMLWLGITMVLVAVWLFRPGFGYMKRAVLTALILGALLFWVDVDARIAQYNIWSYRKGTLETLDLGHLAGLSDGAVPYIAELASDACPEAETARDILKNRDCPDRDLRSWNFAAARAALAAEPFALPDSTAVAERILRISGLDIRNSHILEGMDTHGGFHGDGMTFQLRQFSAEPDFAPPWKALPMSPTVTALCCGVSDETGTRGPYLPQGLLPEIQRGYYLFYDRHSQAEDSYDETAVLTRSSFNFTIIVYDLDAHQLYYLEYDT